MTNEDRAKDIAKKCKELGMGGYAAEQVRQLAMHHLQEAYGAGDRHGINYPQPHPGGSMGR